MPETTIMRDSIVGDDWIRKAAQSTPTSMLAGMENTIISGPVRLAFCDPLFEPRAPSNNAGGTPKYGTMALYTPYSDMNVYFAEYYRVLAAQFPEYYVPAMQGYPALESPFHDQGKKMQYAGFTAGLTYINHTSKYKPPIVDAQRNPIVDRARVYPGVWAVLVVNAYGYGKRPPQPKKGCAFGLQAVMLIGDDKPLAGGGVDPREAFKAVSIMPPAINPASLAALAGQGAPPVAVGLPPGAPGMSFAARPPGAPPMMPPPPIGSPAADEYDWSSLV